MWLKAFKQVREGPVIQSVMKEVLAQPINNLLSRSLSLNNTCVCHAYAFQKSWNVHFIGKLLSDLKDKIDESIQEAVVYKR